MALGRILGIAATLALIAAPVTAETFFLSVPGLCDDPGEGIELADAIYLTKTGLDGHSFGCEWPSNAGRKVLRGEWSVTTKAQCSNGTGSWQAEFEIVNQEDGTLRVFQSTGGISPVVFYRCEG